MREINSLEISFLVKILKRDLVSSKIQKIKQISGNTFSLELYKQKKRRYLVLSNGTIFLSDKSYESQNLTNIGQTLRKRLTNQIIEGIRQHEFDRIVEIETKDYLLVLELFGKGNIILVNKPDRRIISASRIRSWKDRSIRPKREYKYPPSRVNPFKLNSSEFKKYFAQKEVVKVLATDFGFGGEVAEEICRRVGIDKDSMKVGTSKLYKFIQNIDKEFKELKNIKEGLKEGFEEQLKARIEKKKVTKKFERIKKIQEEALKKWQQKEVEYRRIGKLLYERYEEVKKQLDSRKKKMMIDRLTIDLDPKKSVQKNAEVYFEKAKKAKRKIEGLKKAMPDLEKKKLIKIKEETKKEVKKEWYDKFRWFVSSDDFLIVSGKDAQTNEKLIRKYMKSNDLVFHTDITGSPFVLIKNPKNKEIPEQTIKETAEFCGSYSKAWKVGLSSVDVYYIKPDQVKKEGGLPTGSFMIYGKRNWVRRIPVKVVIGIKDNELYFGPEDTVKRRTSNLVTVIPGDIPAYELALKIVEKLGSGVKLEKIERLIPYRKGELSE
jgi:predicted ribosome quality control (RQC) complex YloA/Tae2 family protein